MVQGQPKGGRTNALQLMPHSLQRGRLEMTKEAQSEMQCIRQDPAVARCQPRALLDMGSQRLTVGLRQPDGDERPDGRGHAPTVETGGRWEQPSAAFKGRY